MQMLNVMVPVIVIALAGYLLSHAKKKCDIHILSDIIIYVTAPSLFITTLSTSDFTARHFVTIMGAVLWILVSTIALLWALRRKFRFPQSFYITTTFMNSGFVGVPIVYLYYGGAGMVSAVLYDAVNAVILFSLGIYIISGRKDKWEIFRVPILYAAAIGVALNNFDIVLPEMLFRPLFLLGNATIPLALLMLGYRLGCIKLGSLALPVISAALRGVLGGLLCFIFLKVFGITGSFGSILLIMSVLPSAITGIIFSEKYRKEDSDFVASTIALSTIASMIYIPVLIHFLR